MSNKSILFDVALGLWVLLAGVLFIARILSGAIWMELETVARCVYLIVLTAGIVKLALFRNHGRPEA